MPTLLPKCPLHGTSGHPHSRLRRRVQLGISGLIDLAHATLTDQRVVGDYVDPVVVQRRFDTSAASGIELLELSVQRRFHEQDRIDKATLERALICIDPVTGVG